MNNAAYKEESLRRTAFHLAALVLVSLWASTASAQITPAAGFTPPDDTPAIKVGATISPLHLYRRAEGDRCRQEYDQSELVRSGARVHQRHRQHLAPHRLPHHARRRRPFRDDGRQQVHGHRRRAGRNGRDDHDREHQLRRKPRLPSQVRLWSVEPRRVDDEGDLDPAGPAADALRRLHGGDLPVSYQGTIFVEREGFVSSSDVGLSGHYAVTSDYGDVHVGFYNGDTYSKAEPNDQKAIQARLTLRPLAKTPTWKGLRLTAFYDADHYIKDGSRDRFFRRADVRAQEHQTWVPSTSTPRTRPTRRRPR